jgi:energy-coupling factor transporter ATP-binding protein EcfA2
MAKLATYELAERVVVGFQNPNTQRSGISATVFEEVALGPMNLGLNIEETVERTWAALRLLRLEAIAERNPARLSGGQAQLVGIASLLAMRPGHVILDEPTAQLDPAGTRLVAEALRQLADAGTSLLVAEHKTDLLDGLCARMIVINDGQLVRDGPTADVLADPMLVELGVEPPARVRLQRALAVAGLDSGGLERRKLEGVVLEEARAAAAILPPALEGDR